MGTWGPGNMDGDGPAETLFEYCRELFQRIVDLLQHPRGHEFDEEEYDQIFVTAEIIFAMSERRLIALSIEGDHLRSFYPDYMKRYCNYMEKNNCIWKERVKVMEDSLERLAKIADGEEFDYSQN